MNPGRINPKSLGVSPLKRLSPSRFIAVQSCALREVWAADRAPALLPSSPRAKLGMIVHALLEIAGNGQLGQKPEGQIDQTWARLVSECEEQMSKSWLERSLVPLSKTVPDFEVRRLRTRRIAVRIAEEATSFVGVSEEKRKMGFEVWVETPDELVGGRVDEIRQSANGLSLRDYKTGQILDADTSGGTATVKMDYQTQLRLYAVLYARKFGQWPSRLEIVDLDGQEFEVSFEIASCEALLEEAYQLLETVNNKVTEGAIELLATPGPSSCSACAYRPGCQAYRTARLGSSLTGWPTDIFGTFQYARGLADGRVSLGMNTQGGTNITRVRNLEPTESRHPALKFLKVGDLVGVFNVRGDQQGSDFVESSMTAVYSLESY